jgi:tRNA nucleotidyltransferase (CCA-adding enzyme)
MKYHTHCHKALELRAATLTDMLIAVNAFKTSNSHLMEFLLACEADARGRTHFEARPYPQAGFIREAAQRALAINTAPVMNKRLQGAQIGAAIRQLRVEAIAEFIKIYRSDTKSS